MLKLGLDVPADWTTGPPMLQWSLETIRPDVARFDVLRKKPEAVAQIVAMGAEPLMMIPATYTTTQAVTAAKASPQVRIFEYGNETSYFGSEVSTATRTSTAQAYGRRALEVANALAPLGVRLLVQGDDALRSPSWIANVLAAAPALKEKAYGVTIHAYGPKAPAGVTSGMFYDLRLGSLLRSLAALGIPDMPIWMTEYGISTDDGRELTDNYGWPKAMTYQQVADAITAVWLDIANRFPTVDVFCGFQALDQGVSQSLTPMGTTALNGREKFFGIALKRNLRTLTTKGVLTRAYANLRNLLVPPPPFGPRSGDKVLYGDVPFTLAETVEDAGEQWCGYPDVPYPKPVWIVPTAELSPLP